MNYINIDTPINELEKILRQKSWLGNERIKSIEIPGAGNMNVVLRICTDTRSFILKQSRPYVQKYKDLEAPLDRIDTEYQFYKTVRDIDAYLPKILGYDKHDHLIQMEDLGDTEDLTILYKTRTIEENQLEKLVHILGVIHQSNPGKDYPRNIGLRKLNHQHIFVLPYLEDNGFDLDIIQPGLGKLAEPIIQDQDLKTQISIIGAQYLSYGENLLHGDYYPGSWMNSGGDIYVLDAEFSFVGFKEFDIGVMVAHIIMATMNEHFLEKIIDYYNHECHEKLVRQVAGIEIMRRIIGLAQLPLERTLDEKGTLLQIAKRMVIG